MAKTKISEFSSTPGNNTDIDSINIAEGCAPSGINDAIRELMAQLKDFQTGAVGDSFNGPVGTTTAAAGSFTTLAYTGTLTGGTGVVNLGSGQVYKDSSGNVGVGTTNPAAKFDVAGQVIGQNFACGSTTAAAGSFGATTASGAFITMFGSTASPANTIIFNTSTGEQARLDGTAFKTKQVYSQGVNYNTDSNYDVTPTAVTLANLGFIDSGSFSGMFLINNYTSGGVSIWLCGGGVVSQVSSVAGGAGMSVTHNSGISGYTIQNFTGSPVTLGIFKVRTRPFA